MPEETPTATTESTEPTEVRDCPLRRWGLSGERMTLVAAFAVGVFLGALIRG